jgi:SulP family sulfate permease
VAERSNPLSAVRRRVRTRTFRKDATAGLVLGVQSVPDGLATGLLAGINPLSGLYGYMIGTATGALFTSSAFMAVQGTGAMAMQATRRGRSSPCRCSPVW